MCEGGVSGSLEGLPAGVAPTEKPNRCRSPRNCSRLGVVRPLRAGVTRRWRQGKPVFTGVVLGLLVPWFH